MSAIGFAVFDTAIGQCGIAWSERGVAGVQLPEASTARTRQRLAGRFPQASELTPPEDMRRAIESIVALLRGESTELSGISLDFDAVPGFHVRVYQAARAIAPGTTVSYGQIAAELGAPGSARAVGQALGRNPFAIIVPCHRVLAAGGRVGGFSAGGGIATKLRILGIESAIGAALQPADGAFAFDPEDALSHLRLADPVLGAVIDAAGPFRMQVQRTRSLFGALAEAIVHQQLTGKAAATIFARVCALYPLAHEGPSARQILRTTDLKLRAAGLSRSKILSLKDLAGKEVSGELPSLAEAMKLDNETVVERLTQVRGIGRWTAEMLLMFRLGRADVLPVDDYGIRKGFAVAYRKRNLPSPAALAKHGARWKPFRTVASWYLWRAAELGKR